MNCLKCGRPVEEGQVFCPDCLSDMKAHPVKADTPVQLPVRPEELPVRRNQKRKSSLKPEEIIQRQKNIIRRLILALCVLALLLLLMAAVLAVTLRRQQSRPIGQNYTTVQPTGESAATTAPAGGQ